MVKKKSSPKKETGLLKGKMKPILMKPPSKKERQLTLNALLMAQAAAHRKAWTMSCTVEIDNLVKLARLAVKRAKPDDYL